MNPLDRRTGYDIEPVVMPTVGIGSCRNSRRCKNFMTDLAEGWCVQCWDRGLNTNSRVVEASKKREEEKRLKALSINRLETRGRHKKYCTCEYHTKKGFGGTEWTTQL